ncbi:hypothetical protein PYW07_001399 [Mythimna separata]|uniref:Uncharacterized protein n=1 Tax=Mythimna separata TaxID=271217 RepID=A0AAD8DVU9_MYTSE|nr:hypothetical protein PYW07_001399 [Mythimna separata]
MPHLLFLTETQIRCPADAAYLNYPGYSLEHHFLQRAGVCVRSASLQKIPRAVRMLYPTWCVKLWSIIFPYSDVPVGGSAWFNADCAEAEKRKHSAFLAWADARDRKAPDLSSKKRAFNHAAKSSKKALRKARFDRITHIGIKLSAQLSGSRAFWSLAKSVKANFCRPTLPSLVKPDGTLAHTAREKAGLFASLCAHNSRLDTSSATPPILPHCDSSMSEVRLRNKEVLRALCHLDVNKASGPDGIPAIVLKACAPKFYQLRAPCVECRAADSSSENLGSVETCHVAVLTRDVAVSARLRLTALAISANRKYRYCNECIGRPQIRRDCVFVFGCSRNSLLFYPSM